MGPRLHDGERLFSSVPGGCMGSYSEVASCPASLRMMLEPPGWEGRNSVTSHTLPYKRTQHDSLLLCFCTEDGQSVPLSHAPRTSEEFTFFVGD